MSKVAFLSCVYPPYPGGIGIAAKGMAEAARDNGYGVEVFTPLETRFLEVVIPIYTKYDGRQILTISENRQGQHKSEQNFNIKVTRLLPFGRYGNAAFLPQLIWRLRSFDIIHLFYPFFGAAEFLPIIKRTSRAKIIVHHIMDAVAEGSLGSFFSWHRRHLLPKILRQADLVLDMSEDFFQGSDFGRTRDKWRSVPLDFLPLGVDTNLFSPAGEKNHEIPVIIFVGGLDKAHYFKGTPVLLQSLAILKDKGLKFRCLIVGDGDMRKSYEAVAKKFGLLDGLVVFTGLVPNEKLPDYYRSADIFVMPSTARVESFSIAAAEAQASGLPAVVSDFPGVRVTIEDKVTGFRVRPGDAEELANRLALLLSDNKLREEMGMKGRERMVQNYSWEAVGRKLDEIYKKLV